MKDRLAGRDAEIGALVRRARVTRGLSQEKLGGEIGVTFQQIQKYERGANRIAVSTLLDIARVLDLPVVSLLPTQDESGDPLPVITDPYALRAAELVAALPSSSQRAAVVKMLATFSPSSEREGAQAA
ncbi:MAG: helix-turn-helix transcriptional regulator [Pseudomonadota bacterium]